MDFKINGARIGDTETTVIMNSNTFDIEAYTIDRRRNIDLQIIINDVLVWRSPLTGKEMGSKYCYATTVSLDTSNLNLMDINTVRIIAS